jgi:hypothetical protein
VLEAHCCTGSRHSAPALVLLGWPLIFFRHLVSHFAIISDVIDPAFHFIASSVDAERAFSGGRLQVNHLQHNMSLQTFKAQMAVGSWAGTPLMPDLKGPTATVQSQMKGKARIQDAIVIE